ncbi:hypothetical protein M758_5G113300 [Ceratodon purpureus]|nr:hypothetical protein M758_5G113300 [Ceratodon purpureus]
MADEEASVRLLPGLPSYESRDKKVPEGGWSMRNTAFLASLVLNLIFITMLVAVFGLSWMTPGSHTPAAPQWNDALQAAELAASKWCSGNGNVFVDTLGFNADGSGDCECNDCFTGPDCSISVPDCIADADAGDPLLFEAYWRENADLGTTVIPGWYRMSYRPQDGATTLYTDGFMAAIKDLHALVGNAVTEGRYIVAGTGSMQLINAVVHSLALQDEGRVTPVVAKAPFYNAYSLQTEYLESPLYKFAGEPDRLAGNPNGQGGQIELIASPNNPSFQMQEVTQNVTGPVVYDHAYYWPHLTPITKTMDSDIMLFTLSKITGHAGSRVGWVIMKDFDLFQKVTWYTMINTIGVSHDAQARATQLMRTVIRSYSKGDPGKKGIFHYGQKELQSRWARLQDIFKNTSRFSLQELKPGYCNFFKKVSDPSPGYAWIHCNHEEDVDCQAVMLSGGITGRPGSEFGSSDRYVRLALLKRQSSFENLVAHLEKLVAQT